MADIHFPAAYPVHLQADCLVFLFISVIAVAVNHYLDFSVPAFYREAGHVRILSLSGIPAVVFHPDLRLLQKIQLLRAVALKGQLLIPKGTVDLKHIENSLVDSLCGKGSGTFKAPFSREHERPCERPHLNAVLYAQPVDFLIGGGHIGRIVFRISENHVGIIIYPSGGPAVRIRFRQNHLAVLIAVFLYDIQPQLHLVNQAFHGRNGLRRMHLKRESAAFYMEGDKIKPGAFFLRTEIGAIPAMAQEEPEKLLRMSALKDTCHSRPGKPCFRQHLMHRMFGIIKQFTVFRRCPAPVKNIRLIPKLKIPAYHFFPSVFFRQMGNNRFDKSMPFFIILRGAGPADLFILGIVFPVSA